MLVTGATGGLGQTIARSLAARGARLIVTGRRAEALDQLASELGAETIACDLASRADVARLSARAVAAGVSVMVASAGDPAAGELTELTVEEIDHMVDLNLRAPIVLARELAPSMIARRRGHMVFMSSISGRVGSPAFSIYCATKFGLRGFAQSLRAELRRDGVGVSVVLPGFVREAGMFADSGVRLPPGVGTSSPEEVAAAVIGSIERNRAEVAVAPVWMRAGSSFASAAPGVAATVSRWLGSDRVSSAMVAGHRARR